MINRFPIPILKQYNKKSTRKNNNKTVQFAEYRLDYSGNSRLSGGIFNKNIVLNNRLNLKFSSVPNLSNPILFKKKPSAPKKVSDTQIPSSCWFKRSSPIMIENQHVANYFPFNNGRADRIFVNSLRPNLKKPYAILMPSVQKII